MAATTRTNLAWERVLAAVEADTARAAALLADSAVDPDIAEDRPAEPGPSRPPGVPATWRLPANPDATEASLPDPSDMPPLPAELRERIERLRDRITALQADLATALAAAARSVPRQVHIPAQSTPPGYVDRRL